jgi:hypothetical protein
MGLCPKFRRRHKQRCIQRRCLSLLCVSVYLYICISDRIHKVTYYGELLLACATSENSAGRYNPNKVPFVTAFITIQ